METIIIEWEKVTFKNFIKGLNDDGNKRADEYGLYQIYSTHLIYGVNSLVYIGMAYDDLY